MLRVRTIPCLLLRNNGLVKTIRFKDARYVGDPANTIRIFNEKEVDELLVLDIFASRENRPVSFDLVRMLASECFMPLAYGGGVRTLSDFETLFRSGVEKVAVNTAAVQTFRLIEEAARRFGSQAVIGVVDVRKNWMGRYDCVCAGAEQRLGIEPRAHARRLEELGAGEILLNSVDRDGTMEGYDLPLIASVSAAVSVPFIACGGAGSLSDLAAAVKHGASAAAAGSLFVYQGRNRSVLINFPTASELEPLYT